MAASNRKAKGAVKERRSRDIFIAQGWKVIRPGASIGPADLICLKRGERPLAVQVKANDRSPFMNFRPQERAELSAWAKDAGAVPCLAHWPPQARTHRVYEEWEWPESAAVAV